MSDVPESVVNARHALLRLHKTLLEWERARYERAHGRQSNAELLNALFEHPQFAWLRPMSQLIVRIDELIDQREVPDDAEIEAILDRIRLLTAADESGDDYSRRYHAALQEAPDAVFAHRELVALVTPKR